MSDRLQELLTQRDAIQAHLAWLDREIAQARLVPDPAANIASTSLPATAAPTDSPSGTAENLPDADTLLAGYKQDSQDLRANVRKGCLLYFFGAFLLLGLGVISFYFVNRLIHQHAASAPSEQRAAPDPER